MIRLLPKLCAVVIILLIRPPSVASSYEVFISDVRKTVFEITEHISEAYSVAFRDSIFEITLGETGYNAVNRMFCVNDSVSYASAGLPRSDSLICLKSIGAIAMVDSGSDKTLRLEFLCVGHAGLVLPQIRHFSFDFIDCRDWPLIAKKSFPVRLRFASEEMVYTRMLEDSIAYVRRTRSFLSEMESRSGERSISGESSVSDSLLGDSSVAFGMVTETIEIPRSSKSTLDMNSLSRSDTRGEKLSEPDTGVESAVPASEHAVGTEDANLLSDGVLNCDISSIPDNDPLGGTPGM